MGKLVMLVVLSALLLQPARTAVGGAGEKRLRYSRDDFPPGFVFGSGTSAYQVEGAAAEDGRTPSIWDTFTHAGYARGTGDITADGYHKYKEDVKLMAETGLESYRFSISWSRLIPDGRGNINQKGLEYYNNLIDELVSIGPVQSLLQCFTLVNYKPKYLLSLVPHCVCQTCYSILISKETPPLSGIQPHVTLCHFDLPQVLEDEYEGWLSPKIIDDFTAYANVCFREFGDRVSHWTTINEANVFALGGYDAGMSPPRRCSYPFGNCTHGDSKTEPYIVTHHSLLAHSSVAFLYRKNYQTQQQGFIGLNILGFYFEPLTNSTSDLNAAKRFQDFYIGWLVEPLVRGDYPESMKKIAGWKMPKFSRSQSKQLKGSFDFIGVNYYVSVQVTDEPNSLPADQRDYAGDTLARFVGTAYGSTEIDPFMASFGLQRMLELFKHTYGNPPIYIHENGFPMQQNGTLNDTARVEHMSAHIGTLLDSIRNGSDVRGYLTWSFVDVFEIFFGYQFSYGLYYVDFENDERKRYPKLSAQWYSNFLKRKTRVIIIDNVSSDVAPHIISAM